ncbi:MAG: fused MFS/spermidine synthase [Deltaproteobacteria bacterium]|nr:fused MFS/spermidine synthase [Deltaproteobacteria bacterium]
MSAGTIGMLSTLGSVSGTFAAGFVLIPLVDLGLLFFIVAALQAALAAAGYILFVSRAGTKTAAVAAACALAVIVPGLTYGYVEETPPGTLFQDITFYHRIRVRERPVRGDQVRHLYLDTTVEGAQFVRSRALPVVYQRYWEIARLYNEPVGTALFIGGGAFGMPEAVSDAYPDAAVDVVEIDPEVIEVGRRYFRLDQYPGIRTFAQDARRYLAHTDATYDFIFGDAYNGIRAIPPHLVTKEFFTLVERRLNPGGVFIMNAISGVEGKYAALFQSLYLTLGEIFEHVTVYPLDFSGRRTCRTS